MCVIAASLNKHQDVLSQHVTATPRAVVPGLSILHDALVKTQSFVKNFKDYGNIRKFFCARLCNAEFKKLNKELSEAYCDVILR